MVESMASANATVIATIDANCSPCPVTHRIAPVAKMGKSEGMTLATPTSTDLNAKLFMQFTA